jgi:hypothetical protein
LLPVSDQPPAPAAIPCRACGGEDLDDRVQPDLHRRCMELVTDRAIARRAARRRPAVVPTAAPSRTELIARWARDRAVIDPPARRGRRARPVDAEQDQGDEPALTAEEAAIAAELARSGSLCTGGLGSEGVSGE